mmetsp:Transcript_10048/g.22572  ORF Transcript_10048/g.22572 Transcript_10048/m.22572 type:complete len:321 (-) Transcript_10048:2-964(-)
MGVAKYASGIDDAETLLGLKLPSSSCKGVTSTACTLLSRRKVSSFLRSGGADAEKSHTTDIRCPRGGGLAADDARILAPLRRSVGCSFLQRQSKTSFDGLGGMAGSTMPSTAPGMPPAGMPGQAPSTGMPPSSGTASAPPMSSANASPSFGSTSPGMAPQTAPGAGGSPGAAPQQNMYSQQPPAGTQPQPLGQQQPGTYAPTQGAQQQPQYGAQPGAQQYGGQQPMGAPQQGVQPPGSSSGAEGESGEGKEVTAAGSGAPINPASLIVPVGILALCGGMCVFLNNRKARQPRTDLGGDSASAISDDDEEDSGDSSSDDKS